MYYQTNCNLRELHINLDLISQTVNMAMTIKNNLGSTFTIVFEQVDKSHNLVRNIKKLRLNDTLVFTMGTPSNDPDAIVFESKLTGMSFDKFGTANYNFTKFTPDYQIENTVAIETTSEDIINKMSYDETPKFSLILKVNK